MTETNPKEYFIEKLDPIFYLKIVMIGIATLYQSNTRQPISDLPNSLWKDSASVKFRHVNASPDQEENATLLGIVSVFYQNAVTEAMHQTLSNEVSTGSLSTVDRLFSRTAALSLEALPDSVRTLFRSDTYVCAYQPKTVPTLSVLIAPSRRPPPLGLWCSKILRKQ